MLQITTSELGRKFRQMMNLVEFKGEELVIIRNNHQVARIIPGQARMTAFEAMSDIYNTLSEDAGVTWIQDSREGITADISEVHNPWVS